ncbi:MAG: helix-turn-helix domain-containing protein [Deltaproteobacteria bacterium]|nr:helix-turn-helix domain-containing protein [Deltaproteobacteria bacterium]
MSNSLSKRYFRPDEIAALLKVSKRTVYRLISDGDLVVVKIRNGPVRISEENLALYIKNAIFDPLEN